MTMEILALIALAGLAGAGIGYRPLRRRRPRRDFLDNPKDWGM